jgi:hypothetical protein
MLSVKKKTTANPIRSERSKLLDVLNGRWPHIIMAD